MVIAMLVVFVLVFVSVMTGNPKNKRIYCFKTGNPLRAAKNPQPHPKDEVPAGMH